MPVRSLNSSVLKWPDEKRVVNSLKEWVEEIAKSQRDIKKVGYFGSYSRGDWGVGSDLDVIIVMKNTAIPFDKRSEKWDLSKIPVPVDLLIYTEDEIEKMKNSNAKFYKIVEEEVKWIYPLVEASCPPF